MAMDAGTDVPFLGSNPTTNQSQVPHSVLRRALLLIGFLLVACGVIIGVAGVCSSSYPIILSHSSIAFALGLRHAVDCDHLAAIDNVTRQLLVRGQWPVSVGFWFALGHSTVVLLMTGVLAGGYRWTWQMATQSGYFNEGVTLAANLISILLLGSIGILNAYVAVRLFSDWSGLHGKSTAAQDEEVRGNAETSLRTALSSIPLVKRVFEHVNYPHKMYGVGFLFGLGFDTASQVGVIALAAMTGTSGQVPPLMVMLFPISFSCGMCLLDTTNGLLMLLTYSWTTVRPVQKLFYNFVVTSMSAGIALVICTLELLQIFAREAGLTGGFWNSIQDIDMASIGYSIIASFALVFILAVVYAQGCFECRCIAAHESGRASKQVHNPMTLADNVM